MKTIITNDSTITEGKEYLRQNWEKGTKCPCCNQFVKLYRRKLNSGMSYGLIQIYKIGMEINFKDNWMKVADELVKRQLNPANLDYSKLHYWGLLEQKPNEDDKTKRDSGYWKITERGKKFIRNEIKLQKYVYIYNGKIQDFDGDMVGIKDCLGNNFNYVELMGKDASLNNPKDASNHQVKMEM